MMQNVHFIGIGGAGLSAIATVLLQQGYIVSGSDIQTSPATDRLVGMGATVFIGHQPENLGQELDAVIISSAIAGHNPELAEADRRGLKVLKRADWLGHMMQDKIGIAIAGTHGKTTTSALTAFLLQEAGHQPTYIVGGFIPQMETNAAAGQGRAFIIEADEYDHMFLGLRPEVAVITTVEWDHPDIFPAPSDVFQAFTAFIDLVPSGGLVIGCGDDPGVRDVIRHSKSKVVTYGLHADNDWRATDLGPNQRGGYDLKVRYSSEVEHVAISLSLAIPGKHNVCNALAALAVAHHQGVDLLQAAEILGQFTGVGRRFEVKGEVNGITVVDDYAHHPTEIKATLAAARVRFGSQPLWALFQPHTFSRTMSLLTDFADAFDDADHVIVVDIFASRERDEGLINSQDIIDHMAHPDAQHIPALAQAADYLSAHLDSPAVLLTLGAGDGYQVGEWVLDRLASQKGVTVD